MPRHVVFIVRHGERLDEAEEALWRSEVASDTSGRDKHHLAHDPPLTESGTLMAADAVSALQRLAPGQRFTAVYCSHMRRCIQTAIPFALAYKVPILLSKELSLSAIGVYKAFVAKGHYDYCSLEEIRAFSPSEVIFQELPSYEHHITTTSRSSAHKKPPDWRQTVYRIAAEHDSALIVAHRESIREFLSGTKVKIPYCAVSKFETSSAVPDSLRLIKLVDRHGVEVHC